MIKWEKIARERGFVTGDFAITPDEQVGDPKAMLTALYAKEKSIEGIANELMLSRHTIRVAFERYGIEVKTQGGPQNVKFEVTEALLDEIEANGVTAVARRLDVDYTAVYKRTRDALRSRRASREESTQSETEPQGEKGTPRHDENQ